MVVEYLNLKPNDVKLIKESIRLKIGKKTFQNGRTPVKLSDENIRDINEGKSYITIDPRQGHVTEKDVKHGGALPLLALIPAFAALAGGIASGASSVATAVKTSKRLDKELEEQKRHNLAMEQQKRGGGFNLKRQK